MTQAMLMGLTIQSPILFLASDPILPFNAIAAMSEGIYTEQDWPTNIQQHPNTAWQPTVPVTIYPPAATPWDPIAQDTPTTDHPAKQWEDVSSAWQNTAAVSNTKTVMEICQKIFGWAPKSAAIPAITSSLQEIEQYCLAAPFFTAV
jgi:hypothetical protein